MRARAIDSSPAAPGSPPRASAFTAEQVLDLLRAAADPTGRALSVRAWRGPPSAGAIIKHFGSWRRAVEQAGLEPARHPGPGRRYSDEYLLTAIRAWADANGRSPKRMDWQGPPSLATIEARFGCWSDAVRQAGLAPVPRYTDDDLLEALLKYFIRCGRWPTVRSWSGRPAVGTFANRFGSWSAAIAVAKRRCCRLSAYGR